MTDDPFFERLRDDARALRHEPDDVALARGHARHFRFHRYGVTRSSPTGSGG